MHILYFIIIIIIFFNFWVYLFIYLFMAVLGLHFCVRAFSSCGRRGPLFIAVRGPLTIAASLVAEHRLQTRRLSKLWLTGLVAPWHVGSSQTRARTHVPCIGRQILNHCTTREAPIKFFNDSVCLFHSQHFLLDLKDGRIYHPKIYCFGIKIILR